MKIFCNFPTVNISKNNFWSVTCIPKNLIWTTLKAIFSIFLTIFFFFLRHQIPDYSQILSYPNKPYINGKLIYSYDVGYKSQFFKKKDPYDWFYGPGSHVEKCPSFCPYSLNTIHCGLERKECEHFFRMFIFEWTILSSARESSTRGSILRNRFRAFGNEVVC